MIELIESEMNEIREVKEQLTSQSKIIQDVEMQRWEEYKQRFFNHQEQTNKVLNVLRSTIEWCDNKLIVLGRFVTQLKDEREARDRSDMNRRKFLYKKRQLEKQKLITKKPKKTLSKPKSSVKRKKR